MIYKDTDEYTDVELEYRDTLLHLGALIVQHDLQLNGIVRTLARNPQDELALRRYWKRKTELVVEFSKKVGGYFRG